MTVRQSKFPDGVSLVEVMAAILIVTVAVLGAWGYRYYSALDVKRASMQSTAARIALLLCENWRGRGFDRTATYDPTAHLGSALDISVSDLGPSYPSGFTPLGRHEIVADNTHYRAALSWKDDATAPGLRVLNVVVAWAQRQTGSDAGNEPVMDKTFRVTSYVSDD